MKLIIKGFQLQKKNRFFMNSRGISVLNNMLSVIYYFHNNLLNIKKNINLYFYFFNSVLFKMFIILFYAKNYFYRYIYVISAGLGFKKRKRKIIRGRRVLDLYIGNRHRLAYNLTNKSFIFIFKRSNIIMFSNSKNELYSSILSYRNARKELVFKIKGFYISRYRIRRRIARV
jgi:hypothetical protein